MLVTRHRSAAATVAAIMLLSGSLSFNTYADSCPRKIRFPASGQTQAYAANRNDGNPAAVAINDDGRLQTGISLRFRDNGNGTITDRITGLTWEKKGDDGGPHDKDNRYAWSLDPSIPEDPNDRTKDTIWDFIDTLNKENFGGRNDWRIPNIRELQSLVDYSQSNPAINTVFSNRCSVVGIDNVTGSCTEANAHWSSTTDPDTPENALNLIFDDGDLFSSGKEAALFVRAVRGGCK